VPGTLVKTKVIDSETPVREVRKWTRQSSEQLFEHRLFTLEEQALRADNGDRRSALVLHPTDWVNMIAIDDHGKCVMVRQWRFGIEAETLEIPGGMVEPGEDSLAAAQRELLEETGYEAQQWTQLGDIEPNPAIQSNRCALWLASGLRHVSKPLGDGEEEISLELVPIGDVPALIRDGVIRHSLVIAAFYFYQSLDP